MKRITLLYVTAALLALGAPGLRADTTSTNTPAATPHKGKGAGGREFLHTIGLNPADLKGLSKEDRRAKIQSAAEATQTSLEQKQTAGTITDKEKADLAKIQKYLQHAKKNDQ
jgi:hypothetical protein